MVTGVETPATLVASEGVTESWDLDMTKSKGIYRPRGIPLLEWLAQNSREEPGPLKTSCRVWCRSLSTHGYGWISIGGRMVQVHRVAWVERYGPIPPEMPCVLHRCDNRPCWADGHLWLGTQADNVADMAAKDRISRVGSGRSGLTHWNGRKTHCPAGHPYDEANTYHPPSGGRTCRACGREWTRLYQARRSS